MGWSHKLKGQFEKAIQYYSQSLAILDHLNEEKFYVQNNWYAYINLAEIYLQKKDIRKARNYVEKALNVNAKYNLLEDYKTWAVLGKLYQQEGNYQLALENFQKQLKSVEVEYKSYRNHPLKALALSNIASVYADKKDYALSLIHI